MKVYFLLVIIFAPGLVFCQTSLNSEKNRVAAEKEIKDFVTYLNLTYFSYQQEYVNYLERKNCLIPGGYNIFNDMLLSLQDDFKEFSGNMFKRFTVNAADSLTADSLLNEIKTVWIPDFQTVSMVIEALNERKIASLKSSASVQELNRVNKISLKNYRKFLRKLNDKWVFHSKKFAGYTMPYNYFAVYLKMSTEH